MEQQLGRLIQADVASLREEAQRFDVLPPNAQVHADAPGSAFGQTLMSALHEVDTKEQGATDRMAAVDSCRSDDLIGAMLASQDASLSFSMLMQVRNKVMGAVEDIIKLPL
jgi:flagellar hook-basal body complex protein FliE